MPRGLAPSEKREYVEAYYAQKEAEPTPTPQPPSPTLAQATTVKQPPFVGPRTGRIGYVAQPTTKEEAIEREIASVYTQAPIERQQVGPKYTKQFYAPTPAQEQKIVGLAMQLPPEQRAKYLVEPKPEPKGIGETLGLVGMKDVQSFVAVGIADIAGLKGEKRERFLGRHALISPYLQPKVAPFKEPFKALGGMVASFEAPAYTVGRFVGIKTPRPPPTITGGMIGVALGHPEELTQTEKLGPSYGMGTIVGDIAISWGLGKGAEKAWVVAKKVTPEFIKHPIFQTVKFGRVGKLAHKAKLAVPSFRGSRVDVFLAKHSKWYYKATKGIARGEVAIPRAPSMPTMLKPSQPMLWAKMKPMETAWKLHLAPRTGGVWVGKTALATAPTKAMPHLISVGGKLSIGFLRQTSFDTEPMWKRGLLPFVTQTQQTRMGLIPYIPKLGVRTFGKTGGMVVGAGVALAPKLPRRLERKGKLKLTPKIPSPILPFEQERLKIPSYVGLEERQKTAPMLVTPPKLKQITPQITLPSTTVFERTRQEGMVVPMLKEAEILHVPEKQVPTLRVPQIQRVPQTPFTPTILVPPFTTTALKPPFFPYFPRGGRDVSRGAKGMFGRWFKRTHPIKTPKQMWATFSGGFKPRRRVKRKRKGKKRRKGGERKWFLNI